MMVISTATRTHLIYQFIILTLLFLGIGYNELLPDRKFILLIAFTPIFCYQLVILSCFMEFIPVPRWMGLLESTSKKDSPKLENLECGSQSSSLPILTTSVSSHTQTPEILNFPDVSNISSQRRWEKSVTNLRVSPKCFAYPQKSKSWMSLNESQSSEGLLSREESLDILASISESKCGSRILKKTDKTRNREERAIKAQSWKPCETDFEISDKTELCKSPSLSIEPTEPQIASCAMLKQEESELAKSYSFPFRQKRLESWLEMKETRMDESDESLNMPYWQTVGYNLAVKYEARRRRRATSNPSKSNLSNEESIENLPKSAEIVSDSANIDRPKKCSKSASACINKLKVGFTNLISKKKEDVAENNNFNSSKVSKSISLLKLKSKNSCPAKEKETPPNMPDFPQFLTNNRPLIFYPKHLPFEKERFESDVKKKMKEIAEGNYST